MKSKTIVGYAMLAGKKLGLNYEQLDMLNSLLDTELEETSEEEAEKAYSEY